MKTAGYKGVTVKAHGALIACILFLLLSTGCGGSSSDSDSDAADNNSSGNDAALTGMFIDAVVEGLKYEIGSTVNSTGSDGAFQYSSGDEIQFYIGAIKLGNKVAGNTIITPLDLVENGDYDNDEAINIARFLQTLDSDKSDGSVITIPSSVHERAEEKTLAFDSSFFDDDAAAVIDALTNGNDDYVFVPSLVSRAAAIAHLKETLGDDTSSEDSDDTDEEHGTIVPFTRSEVVGTYMATISDLSDENSLTLSFTFYEDMSLELIYPLEYSDETFPTEWEVTDDGRIMYVHYGIDDQGDVYETTLYITNYTDGTVLWTNSDGIILFRGTFIKAADDEEDVSKFLGTWEATDPDIREDITSVGDFVISESDGSYYANGSWNIDTPVPMYGRVTTHIEFSDIPVTISDGAMHFTATVESYTDVVMFGTSRCTLEVYDATPASCSYRIQFYLKQWIYIWETYILESTVASDDWVYVGNASVTVFN